MNTKEIISRFDQAQSDKEVWNAVYRAVFRMTMPNRDSFYMDENIPNTWENVRLLTTVGVAGADVFATRGQRICSDDGEKFVQLSLANWYDSSPEINDMLGFHQDLINYMLRPNMGAIYECWADLVAGTAVYYKSFNRITNKFSIIPIPIKDVALTKAFDGSTDGYYRKLKMRREEIPSAFPELAGQDTIAGIPITKDNAREVVELKECTIFNYEDNKWHYVVILDQEKIVERLSDMCDMGSLFWTRRPGTVYGIGVGLKALPELNQLNALKYYGTFGLMFRAAPMWLASQEAMLDYDRLEMKPMEIIEVPSTSRDNPSIAPLQVGDDPNVVQWNMAQMEMNIKEIMTSDTIPSQTNQKLSATEIAYRANRLDVNTNNIQMVALQFMSDCVVWLLNACKSIPGFYPDNFNVQEYINAIEISLASSVARNASDIQAQATMIDMFNAAVPDGSLTRAALNIPVYANSVKKLLKIDAPIIYDADTIQQNLNQIAQAAQNAAIAKERAVLAREVAAEQAKQQITGNVQ